MVFLVLLIPVGVLAFALLMERLESRLRTGSVSAQEVEEFLENAEPDEVTTFVKEGWTRALSRFRVRSRRNRPSRRRARGSRPSARTAGRHGYEIGREPAPAAGRAGSPPQAHGDVTPNTDLKH